MELTILKKGKTHKQCKIFLNDEEALELICQLSKLLTYRHKKIELYANYDDTQHDSENYLICKKVNL